MRTCVSFNLSDGQMLWCGKVLPVSILLVDCHWWTATICNESLAWELWMLEYTNGYCPGEEDSGNEAWKCCVGPENREQDYVSVLLVYSIHDRLSSSTPTRICTHPRTLGTTLCYDLETLCVRNIDILLRTYSTSYGCSTQVKDYIIPFLGLRLCTSLRHHYKPFLEFRLGAFWGHLDVLGDSHDRSSRLLVF